MITSGMGDRWTTYKFQYSFFSLLFLVLAHMCSSLNFEGLALLDFQARVSDDPYGSFKSWNSDDHDPCSWSHVQCVFGHVQALDLKGLCLEGVLAPELGNLARLGRLVLSHNHFFGVIPKELGELKMLEVLDLSYNNLTGSIPPEIGNIKLLNILLLYNNNLEGTIPTKLESLHCFCNFQFDNNLTLSVTNAIGFLNRKVGRCIWMGGFNPLRNADSLLSPLKETVINYLNQFQLFSKGISYSSCDTVQNLHIDGSVISRKLVEEPARGHIISFPSSRSRGSFPVIRVEKNKPDGSQSPSSETSNGDSMESQTSSDMWMIMIGVSCVGFFLFTVVAILFNSQNPSLKTMAPWSPGLTRQLQKAFVTGVQKLDRIELETACEDFSNIIKTNDGFTLFKGTLSSGVEICVASTTITRLKDWSKRAETAFHKKIETLSRVNHKNFVNLIGYCEEEEPFVRMMVFEYAPDGSLSEHLQVQELGHLDWRSRMRIIMGVAYCLQCMHDLSPPVVHMHLDTEMIYLTDDYAAKVADLSFWKEFYPKTKISGENESTPSPHTDKETNVYSFGVLLLEIISGKHPIPDKLESLVTWAEQFLKDKQNISHMIDPTLKSFKQNELEVVCEVIQECIKKDAKERPTINEIVPKLMEVLGISPKQATPRLSPLWWAELELLSIKEYEQD